MRSHPEDTSPEVDDLQARAHRALGPEGRVGVALDLSDSVRELRLAGLRAESQDASRRELVERFISEVHGISPELLK